MKHAAMRVEDYLRQQLGKGAEPDKQPEKPKAVGKRPRILRHLAVMYPKGVPDPGLCPRIVLRADLLKRDPGLAPLDETTLKSAIEAYNADLKRS